MINITTQDECVVKLLLQRPLRTGSLQTARSMLTRLVSRMRPVRVVRPARASYEIRNVASVRHSWGKEFDAGLPKLTVLFDDPELRRWARDPLIF